MDESSTAHGVIDVVAADWLRGRLRSGTGHVVGVGSRSAVVEMAGLGPGGGPGIVAIEDHRGVGLPCGVRLPAAHAEVLGSLRRGLPVSCTPAGITIGTSSPVRLRVARWHRCRPSVGQPAPATLAARLAVLVDPAGHDDGAFDAGPGVGGRDAPWWVGRWPDLDPVLAAGVRDLVTVATGGDRPSAEVVVARLLGHGPGSTPAGDDLMAGFVATARVLGGADMAVDGLAASMRAGAGRTTLLSATLLGCADDAAMAMPAAGFLQVVLAPATSPDRIEAAFDRLVAIGHTSGHDLALGIVAALRVRGATTR